MARFVGAARRSSRRFTSSSGREKVWTSLISATGLVSTTAIGFLIVEPVDWERSAVAQEHATLTRIRGWLSIAPQVADSQYNAMIIRINQTRGSPDPSIAQTLVDEDILWTYAHQAGDAIGVGMSNSVEVDVKAMRKITSSENIRMVEISDTVNGFVSTYTLRGLLSIK